MASVCGGSLALFDAGGSAPLGRCRCLDGTHQGRIEVRDPDRLLAPKIILATGLQVAGTETGITSIQMDIKSRPRSADRERALAQAKEVRLHILGEMAKALAEPRSDLSAVRARIVTVQISPEKIGDLIGPKARPFA